MIMQHTSLCEGCRSPAACRDGLGGRAGEAPHTLRPKIRQRLTGIKLRAESEHAASLDSHADSLLALDGVPEASHSASTLEARLEAPGHEQEAFQMQPASQPLGLLPGPPRSHSMIPPESAGGWVWAVAILVAARLGRVTAQEARLDVRQLQFERERSRALSKELLRRREEYNLAEGERSVAEAARRVEVEAARALEEFRRQQELQKKYQEEAAREAERLRAEQDIKRQQYEAEQARLDAEYRMRVEQERRVIEEQRARAAEAEAQRRRAEEERRRQLEEERRQRDEAERREREETIQRKLEERRRLEKEKKRFALRLEGSVAAERPPKGTVLPGPLQKEATVRVSASAGSMLGGACAPATADFATSPDAAEALPALLGRHARAACDAYASAVRLQHMTGEGPLSWMDEVELRHWMALAATRTALGALRAGEAALQRIPANEPFQLRTEYGVLPEDHPQRSTTVLARIISLVEAGNSQQARAALADMQEAAIEEFYADLPQLPTAAQACPRSFLPSALLLANLLERCLADRPARVSDAPAWFESAVALAREWLQESAAGAPPDSLQAPAALLGGVLGQANPLAQEASRLAQANLSAGAKRVRQERERMAKAELAAKLLEEEWPDGEEIRAARMAEKEASTPIPERVWALRNVAGTLALGGPSERGRARKLLEQAVMLKQQFAGAPDHPGMLPELVALLDVLERDHAWRGDAAGVAGRILAVLRGIAEGYAAGGDGASAAIVLESGLRKYDELVGMRHPAVSFTLRRLEGVTGGLTPEQRQVVAQYRSKADAVLSRLCEALTEPLQAYQQGGARSRVEEWNQRGTALLGPFT